MERVVDWGWGGCCDVYNVEMVEMTILDGYDQITTYLGST